MKERSHLHLTVRPLVAFWSDRLEFCILHAIIHLANSHSNQDFKFVLWHFKQIKVKSNTFSIVGMCLILIFNGYPFPLNHTDLYDCQQYTRRIDCFDKAWRDEGRRGNAWKNSGSLPERRRAQAWLQKLWNRWPHKCLMKISEGVCSEQSPAPVKAGAQSALWCVCSKELTSSRMTLMVVCEERVAKCTKGL